MFAKLAGYKTYLTAGLGILTAWCAYFTGDLPKKDAVEATFAAVATACVRHGISTGK